MDRMAELDVVPVMELASLGLAMFQMMDQLAELVLELVLTMFRMKMDQMAELVVVRVMVVHLRSQQPEECHPLDFLLMDE
ncbi:hypothetical protein DERF_007351 [Dermatophagoides farinae]|uniref:Uncharacterized protein n=1 Tax=Dermatophagoides farinae TaxID=6954 RepID=A0A922HY03_DERFA|nr:hypothetical protein DERF_007351 [Dermatophagoides farinae]